MWLAQSAEIRKKLHQVFADDWPWASSSIGQVVKKGALRVLNVGIGQAVPFASRNGFEVLEFRSGFIKAKIPLKGNKNHFGAMYAGAIFTVAEIPGGVVAMLNFDDDFYPVLKDQKVEFVKKAKSDVTVSFEMTEAEIARIQSEADECGKSEFVLLGEIKDCDEQIVARSYGTYQLHSKSRRPGKTRH
ncbi:PaaI family thioesterase [Pseudobacteriovorax antillogorgiicola]|uniref:Acyl-coenzyme A thioesterase PaaI, contains HGG motif n=1 Tax=Pseudobacteriovorax antillogorgiicola TaxID=1513793 RepID=A0A1Y6BTG0_9BACT|nr:YiiD C-terminal domain-containing protein [Pseudobacteriovorax antillogorgiicola]TCS52965.1 acyl-coenzyme A thioesterase PaaI-like protein [Pseudobacteriovorax antillogorgiicola]SMF27485.1 Acyl-coenzyme A thioesterase PaaI, contains HGG motif [Pseudobacteriovorax antillogorgiicola]